MKKIFNLTISLIIVISLVVGCTNSQVEVSEEIKKIEVAKIQKSKHRGLKLELDGVAESNKDIFIDNFYMLEEGFEALTANREDLQSAEMTYYAKENRVNFTYYYTPNLDDIDIISSEHAMEIKLVQYNYIGKELSQYFNKVNNEFKNLNIDFVKPDYVIYYQVDDDNYLATHLESQFVIKFGVQMPNEEMVEVYGDFASGTVKSWVKQPKKTVSGDFTSEYSLIKFFYQFEDEIVLDSGIDSEDSKNMEYNTNKILQPNEELINGAINNKLDRIKILVSSGADINYQNEHGITALMESARNGHKEIVKLLISEGADVNIMAANTETALLWAVDEECADIVELLANAGANTNIKGEFDRTPLWMAAKLGNIEIAKILLENGANPNLKLNNEDESTPLSIAKDKGITELIKLLESY